MKKRSQFEVHQPNVITQPPAGIVTNHGKFQQRLLIGTPMTGLVRAEWVSARYNQWLPTNWSHMEFAPFMHSHVPLRFQVADAENLIARMAIEKECAWLLFVEHDNVLPQGAFVRLNDYMIEESIPVVSALYFTKSDPPEPLIYKDFGWGHFRDWKIGDKVWCKGHGFGCCLIHMSIIKALWDSSPEYVIDPGGGQQKIITRRVFNAPSDQWYDPELGIMRSVSGTSDLQFCERVMKEHIFEKAGWPEFQKRQYPFLVDTNIMVSHINDRGIQFPVGGVPTRYHPEKSANGHKPHKKIRSDFGMKFVAPPDMSTSAVIVTGVSEPGEQAKKRPSGL